VSSVLSFTYKSVVLSTKRSKKNIRSTMNVRLRGVRRRQLDTPPPIWERSIVVNVSCVFMPSVL